jgi:hypothetical protein
MATQRRKSSGMALAGRERTLAEKKLIRMREKLKDILELIGTLTDESTAECAA